MLGPLPGPEVSGARGCPCRPGPSDPTCLPPSPRPCRHHAPAALGPCPGHLLQLWFLCRAGHRLQPCARLSRGMEHLQAIATSPRQPVSGGGGRRGRGEGEGGPASPWLYPTTTVPTGTSAAVTLAATSRTHCGCAASGEPARHRAAAPYVLPSPSGGVPRPGAAPNLHHVPFRQVSKRPRRREPSEDGSSLAASNPEQNTLFEAVKSAKIAVEVTHRLHTAAQGAPAGLRTG